MGLHVSSVQALSKQRPYMGHNELAIGKQGAESTAMCTAGQRINWQAMPHRDEQRCPVLATAELALYQQGCGGMHATDRPGARVLG